MTRYPNFFIAKFFRYLNTKMFFLSKLQFRKLNKLRARNIEDYKTWSVYTIVLPISAYVVAFLINILFLVNYDCLFNIKTIFETLNNGSLPIIGFGIVSSSISYLMEIIDSSKDQTTVWFLRRKIMAISVLFLFLTSAIYILQSINRKFITIQPSEEVIIFFITIVVLICAISAGRKMFLLQKNVIEKDFAITVRNGKNNLTSGLGTQFGTDGD